VNGEFRPVAKGNKFEALVGLMEELGFPGRPASKLVVASQFTQLLNAFQGGVERSLKLEADRTGKITGEVSQARRDDFIDQFEDVDNPLDILFINTKAGGSSITLDAADIMVILDETWVDDEQEQLEGRIDNRNPERKIVPRSYYYFRSLGTVEEQIAIANAEAKANGKRILDGMRPMEFAKRILQR
jgi:SNF2 family DNA or RNA helicase